MSALNATLNPSAWSAYGVTLNSRLLLGTAGYPSPQALHEAIVASGTEVVTVGLRRVHAGEGGGDNGHIAAIRSALREQGARLLPNTAGCRTAREAVELSHMARELYDTAWIKLEVVGDEQTLQPDPWELVLAAEELVREGFQVFPYCTDDLVTCQRLLDVGCEVLLYTQETRRTLVSACFRAGASGIVGKNDELEELVEAIRCLQAGEPYLSSDWAAALDDDQARIPNLTPREADALRLYATGLPLKSVARRMEVGEQTAREYLLRARKKYTEVGRPADTRTDLYIRAIEDGVLPSPGDAP